MSNEPAMRFTFRAVTRDDFPMLAAWLDEPHVARWWNHETSPEAIERDFGGAVDGTDPCDDLIVHLDGEPIGLLQSYWIASYPDDVAQLSRIVEVPDGARGIDYLIADRSKTGRGIGPAMIDAFVSSVWVDHRDARCVMVAVVSANRPSWRALQKAGFTTVGQGDLEPDNPIDDPAHEILRIDRPSS